MRRRDVLASAGLLGALGVAGCLAPAGVGRPDPETDTPTPPGTTTPGSDEPAATATVGDRSAVRLPDENGPHVVRVRNADDRTRVIGVRVATDGEVRYDNAWALEAGAAVRLTLVEPAAYVVTVSEHGAETGSAPVRAGLFDCNDSVTTIAVGPEGDLDVRTASTLVACQSPIVVGADLVVTDSGCGGEERSTVAFGPDAVTVTGAITAPNPCHGAALAGVAWDGEAERLTLTVATTDPDAAACVDCVGAIEYEATVSVAGDPPPAVAVDHRHFGRTDRVTAERR
jgi:hypothetical protein